MPRTRAHRRLALVIPAVLLMLGVGFGSAFTQPLESSADRYGTAARAALDAFPEGANVAVLASGEDYPDALAAAPLAAFYDAPILLTGRTHLPAVTHATLAELGVADVLVMGGTAAVSHDVTNTLHIDYQVSRVAGGL
jgi:putative cell wall-binding protein